MASISRRTICAICNKEKITYPCDGCTSRFCIEDLTKHRTDLSQQLDQIQSDHDQLRENLNDQKLNPMQHSLIREIDQWESDAIKKIQQTAQQCRDSWMHYANQLLLKMERKLNDLSEQIKVMNRDNEFNELDLNDLKEKLDILRKDLQQPANISIREQPTSFLNKISLLIPLHKGKHKKANAPFHTFGHYLDTQWKQSAMTIAGGNGEGNRLDQLSHPYGICCDDRDQTIYIADSWNHRILEWKFNAKHNRIVAGGNGKESRIDQLNLPTDVIIDRHDNSLIVADHGNRRVMRWSRQANVHGQILISDIDCYGLAMHEDGSLYVSDCKKHEIRRWRKGETKGTVVAGGNGQGNQRNQVYTPTYLFVSDDHTLYVSDLFNHRVMKWMKNAKEGIIVAGGNGQGDLMTQLSHPHGVVIDQFGQIYVSDRRNHRVMRWCEGAKEGTIVIGCNGKGQQANQLSYPVYLSLDGEGNLYVVEEGNHRIQKFEIQ